MSTTLLTNARIFTADRRSWASAMVVAGERILYVGDEATARRMAAAQGPADEHDLGGALVLPGFVDGHSHILMTGEVATQVSLWGATTLDEVQRRIAEGAARNPDAPRIRAHGWQHASVPGGVPTRQQLDAVVADRPVYVQAYDFHSVWLNSAALADAGIDDATPDPHGGTVHRDAEGHATGYVDETAMQQLVWPYLASLTTDADRDDQLAAALEGYARLGVTGATDMGLGEDDLAAMRRAESAGALTTRIAGHWMVGATGDAAANLAQVARAAALAAAPPGPMLRVVGIKIVIDGTVDGCTAALGRPYADGSNAEPIWSLDELAPVVTAADAAGLKVAMHAIGDEAVRIAIGAVEAAVEANGPRPRRHRIEHLEVVERADIERLAALGIAASMQPVHADPAIQDNWRARLADERVDRGFPWPEMTEAGAPLVFGSDSPTSDFAPLPNMFVAATRRSALDPSLEPNVPRYALPLTDAVEHATRDAAWASGAEEQQGRLAPGLLADFVVVDRDVFAGPPEELLRARVLRTVVGGRTVFEAGLGDGPHPDGAEAAG